MGDGCPIMQIYNRKTWISENSRQSNLTKGRIAAAHGWFSGIQQVATVHTPHNRSTRFLGATRVVMPNGISIGSAILHGSWQNVPILYSGPLLRSSPFKTAPAHGGSGPPSNADDTRSRNRRQKPAPENWRRFLAPVFHASCKISGARNQHGRIKSNQTFYLAIRPTHVK